MCKSKYSLLLLLFAGIMVVSCTRIEKNKIEKTISFDQNLIATKEPEFVCRLIEDSILLGPIKDFTFLNDTSFVVVDGRGAYLYHISGVFKKQFGNSGQAGGEYLSPDFVYATPTSVYVWCSSLMKILIFDHEAHLKDELSNFGRGIRKFVVDSNEKTLYLYTSGIFEESGHKMIDVIDVYNIAEKSSKKYGERSSEDEVLSVVNNSGGLYTGTNQLIYLHPGNLIIHDLDLNTEKTVRYKIEDKAFYREEVTDPRNIINDRRKLINYMLRNSVVRGFYKDKGQFIIVSEIGQFDFDMQSQVIESPKNRKIKLYILNSSFIPNRTILYDYINSQNIVVYSGAMYYLDLKLDGDEDQIITLNRFSLSEE